MLRCARSSIVSRLIRLAAATLIAVFGIFLLGTTPASAHATVVSSVPVDGSNAAAGPAEVSITFDESVGLNPGYVRVIDGGGHRVDTGDAFHPDGRSDTVSVRLESNLPRAAYLASYRVVSADSHPVSGVVRFSVGGASLADLSGAGGQRTDKTISVLLDVARAFVFVGIAAAGGWWLLLWLGAWPSAGRRLVAVGLGAALVGVLIELLAQGPYAAGDGVGGLVRPGLLADTLASSFGRWHLAQLVVLAILFIAIVSGIHEDAPDHRRTAWALGGGAWAFLLFSIAATGHAAVRTPVWLGELSTTLHLIAMTLWIGGLAVLAVAVLTGEHNARVAATALPVFSNVALVSVGTLAATGSYQAWREVGGWRAFVDTEYGVLVLVKIGLFSLLIGLGVLARLALRDDLRARQYADADADAVHPYYLARLRRGVLIEIALAVTVLIVSAVLVAQPPGRTANATVDRAATSATVALSADRKLTLQVNPGRHGTIAVIIAVGPGAPVQKMTVTATLPSASIGPIPVPVDALDDLDFQSGLVDLPAAGIWQFSVSVQTSEFDIISATVPITLR
ncbi:MAG: copC [Pseudonocardiales bacterium]|nr:copC [Pseudonocardiales bacterium]